jgi:hypothetical protein
MKQLLFNIMFGVIALTLLLAGNAYAFEQEEYQNIPVGTSILDVQKKFGGVSGGIMLPGIILDPVTSRPAINPKTGKQYQGAYPECNLDWLPEVKDVPDCRMVTTLRNDHAWEPHLLFVKGLLVRVTMFPANSQVEWKEIE